MAYYMTFEVLNKYTNKIVQKYLYNVACTSQAEIDSFTADGITRVRSHMIDVSGYIIKPIIRNYRDLTNNLKSYKFIDPERVSAPYTPSLIVAHKETISRRPETSYHYN